MSRSRTPITQEGESELSHILSQILTEVLTCEQSILMSFGLVSMLGPTIGDRPRAERPVDKDAYDLDYKVIAYTESSGLTN